MKARESEGAPRSKPLTVVSSNPPRTVGDSMGRSWWLLDVDFSILQGGHDTGHFGKYVLSVPIIFLPFPLSSSSLFSFFSFSNSFCFLLCLCFFIYL